MPVPSVITDLTSVASGNFPVGADAVFPELDNYLRAHASFIKQNYDTLSAKANTSALTAYALVADLANTADAAKGDAMIGVKKTLANAVGRALHDWFEDESVCVFEFFTLAQVADVKARTRLVDVTTAIQNALNSGKSLRFPQGDYLTSASLTLNNQHIYGDAKEKTIFAPNGNFPCFINSVAEFICGGVHDLMIDWGTTAPTVVGTDGLKVGIKFAGASKWPTFYSISDVTIRGAWWGFYDDTGTYMSRLERVHTYNCRQGFFKQNGTTMVWENCFAQGGIQGFYIDSVLSALLSACASDNLSVSAGANGNVFLGCMGLTIDGWDAESNSISGNGASLFFMNLCTGRFSGLTGYLNTWSCDGGDSVSMIKTDSTELTIDACRTMFNGVSLQFTGTGTCYALLATDASKVLVEGSNVDAGTGGTPAARYSMAAIGGSSIRYVSTTVNGSLLAAHELADTEVGTFTPVPASLTVVGAPTYSGKYVRHGKTVYGTIRITNSGGSTTASTAGTTVFTGLPYNPSEHSTNTAVNVLALSKGIGLVHTNGGVYPPTWAADGSDIVISFTYQVA